jgi:branched-chain amino acid transport system substrate-binding protein
MKKFLAASLIGALATLLLATGPGAAADDVTIDAIVSLTGTGAFAGHDSAQTFDALQRLVNATGGIRGRALNIVVHDDQSNPQVAVQLFTQLAAKHDQLILGPTLAATCGAVLPLLKNVVDYCISPAAHPKPGSDMFSGLTDSSDQFRAMFRYFALRGLRRIATITTTDATGQDADRGIAEMAATTSGVTIVDREHFASGDISVTAQVEHIKTTDPQLLIAWTTGTGLGTILRSIADVGLTTPVITSSGNMSIVELRQYASFMPGEMLFPATPVTVGGGDRTTKAAIAVFDKALAAVGVAVPSQVHQLSWDPGMIEVSALRTFGPDATAEQIHDYIAGLRGWTGIQGPYDFPAYPQRGLGLGSVIITRWNPSAQQWIAVSKGGGIPLGH